MVDDLTGWVLVDRDKRMGGRRVVVLGWVPEKGKYKVQSAYWHRMGKKRGYTHCSHKTLFTRFTKVGEIKIEAQV